MPTLFDSRIRASILDRIARLTPEQRPRFGSFTAPQMICHVSASLSQALGDLDASPRAGPFSRFPINWLIIYVVPWPGGKGKSPPEFLVTPPGTWGADRERLYTLIERFCARGPNASWPASPVFGRISGRDWGVMQHKHLNHHLRQFGV